MQDIIQSLGDFKEVIASIIVIVITAMNQYRAKKRGDKISEKISDVDTRQDKRISIIEEKLNQNIIAINSLTELLKDEPKKRELKSKITSFIEIEIESKNIVNPELKRIFKSGEEVIYYVVDYLFRLDFLNITVKFCFNNLRERMVDKFKFIRDNIDYNKLDVDESYSIKLKEFIHVRIDQFISHLMQVKSGYFNGTSKKEFNKAFENLIKNIIEDAVKIHSECQMKQNI